MGRKSGWQQFADNFKAVYGAATDFAKDSEFRDIMDAQVEELEFSPDDMGDPEATKWSYLGEEFDTKPTADQMRGLRYKAIGDSRMRYGDVEGALDMQLRREEIDAKAAENKLNRDLYKELLFQRGVGKSNQMRADTANTQSSTDLNSANTDKVYQGIKRDKALLPGELLQQGADLEKTEAETDNLLSTTSRRDLLAPVEFEQESANLTGTQLDNVNKGLRNSKDGIALEQQMTEADIKRFKNEATLSYMKRVAEGGDLYGKPKEAKAAFLDIYKRFDPEGAVRFGKMFNEEELGNVLHKGTMISQSVKTALTDKTNWVDNITKLIDDENGLDHGATIFEDGGKVHLASTDMETGKIKDIISSADSYDALRQQISDDYTNFGGATELALKMAEIEKVKAQTKKEGALTSKYEAEAKTGPRDHKGELLQKGLQDFLTDSDAYQVATMKGDKETMLAIENNYRKSVGLAPRAGSQAPDGIPQNLWEAMTDEEKKAFQQ